ncbi:MAG TPA: ERCC4 domain-containing protein [Candidatus Hydrogenedentes bacterium]|nr:ERCC4 domain-containing protein [Candidatus Hydrogenedentota bacterium]
MNVHIVIDHREARTVTASALAAQEDALVEYAQLSTGDYQIEDTFVFERKTLSDFSASIQDGRIFRQALALTKLPPRMRGVLILEGSSADLSESAMRRESLQGALITISLFFGIPILRSLNGEESAKLMVYAARQSRTFASHALPRHGKRPRGKRKAQLALLQGLPGVGPGRAEELLDRFGSIESICTAAPEELASVSGIGKHTAEKIRWVLG